MHSDQHESILEGLRELFSASVALSWILCGENAEPRVGLDHSLCLDDVQLSIVIK